MNDYVDTEAAENVDIVPNSNEASYRCPYDFGKVPFYDGIRFDCDTDSGHVDYVKGVTGVRNAESISSIKEIYITDYGSCVDRFILGVCRPESHFGVLSLPAAPTAIVSIGGWSRKKDRPVFTIGENDVVAIWQRDVFDNVNDTGRKSKGLLTLDDADSFASFIRQLSGTGAERLVVHCGSGISRSSAAAAAASKALWGDDLWAFARPNIWGPNADIYTKLLHGLGLLDDMDEPDCVPRARHRFAEWCYNGDDWLYSSYNADYVDCKFYGVKPSYMLNRKYKDCSGKYTPLNNPLLGTRDWELLQKLTDRFDDSTQ